MFKKVLLKAVRTLDYLMKVQNSFVSQTTNFRLFQIERVCRRKFGICWIRQKVLLKGRKHCGKRRNCSLWAISHFPSVFSKSRKICCACELESFLLDIMFDPLLYYPWERSLLNTLMEKEKMLVTSIFSFSHNVFFFFTKLKSDIDRKFNLKWW